jgi:hypothetical protein
MTAARLFSLVLGTLLAAVVTTTSGVQLQTVLSTGLASPVFVTHAGDRSNRLFIVERGGTIRVLQPGGAAPTLFLDIRTKVATAGGEQGLLGLAFHPQYATNGRFFVSYTRAADGAIQISEFAVSSNANVAASTETPLLTIPHPTNTNHNGGMLAFGPDGFLYIGVGDGGSGNDPPNNAQNLGVLLGKILRIDVNHPDAVTGTRYSAPPDNPFVNGGGRREIFAYGLRNPWRFSFDRATGQMWVGDVGQGAREEVDTPIVKGGNYGWRVYEGSTCTNLSPALCNPASFLFPVLEYGHTGGRCSITGGYVYRGNAGALAKGTYVYADYCTGEIFSWNGSAQTLIMDSAFNVASFGEDEQGELYVVDLKGTISRLAADPTSPGALVNGSFEVPALGNGYQYGPSASGIGWSFGNGTGIQGNGSAWHAAAAPGGTQTAFIQGAGAITQSVSLTPGNYTLTFQVARRAYAAPAGGVQPLRVTVDGAQIGANVVPSGTSFAVVSIPFSIAASGAHVIGFSGTDASGDKTTFVDAVSVTTGAPPSTLANASFETPRLGSGYQYAPTASGVAWTFGPGAGIQANGSAWGATTAPNGTQTAFVQGTGSIAQTVTLATGTYSLIFQVARRSYASPFGTTQPVRVSVDGQELSTVTPSSTSFAPISLQFTVVTQGAHTIAFAGTDGTGDKSTFIDAISLAPTSGAAQ